MIHQEQFLVRAIVQVGNVTLATAMAAATDLEAAEDRAKLRVLEFFGATFGKNITPIASMATAPFLSSSGSMATAGAIAGLGESSWQSVENSVPSEAAMVQSIAPQVPPRLNQDFDLASNDPGLEQTWSQQKSSQILDYSTESGSEHLDPSNESDLENSGFDLNLPRPDQRIEQSVEFSRSVSSEPNLPAPIATATSSSATSSSTASSSGHGSRSSKPAKHKPSLTETPEISIPPSPNLSANLADRSEEIMKIGIEMKRLGWSTEQGREYLKRTYGKRSRQELEDAELLDFLRYLELQPSPMQTPF